MTNRINKAEGADGVHRLIDMVVEEVSLVDRAANKHRFLIVKRDDTMDEDMLTEAATDAALALDAASGRFSTARDQFQKQRRAARPREK